MEQLIGFWDQKHREHHRGSLSGSEFDETMQSLQLESHLRSGQRFLEIGVGLGYVTKALARLGEVSALDVSEQALDRVRAICTRAWTVEQVSQLPTDYFDIIICNNVIQHVPTDVLKLQLEHVIRSLAPGGVLALEYVWKKNLDDTGADAPIALYQAGYACRSDSFMIDMVRQLGGRAQIRRSDAIRHKTIDGVSVMHVTKGNYFQNKNILITGGTGSWGQTLTQRLLAHDPAQVTIFSRGELQQVNMQRQLRDARLKFVIGDVRDYDSVSAAMRGVDLVFHLAALKHVPVCEDHPQEAIKTNIHGTTNVVNAAIANKVHKVIDISTDKAVEPLNLYGMTKSVGEKLILQANSLSTHTKFVCVRGGNVMGSNGSVIPYFIQQIKQGGPVTITDMRMTRFFLTLNEAIDLLFKAAEVSDGGETFVMNMPACRIADVVTVLMDTYGRADTQEIGIKPGEKLDEMLISHHEAALTRCFDDTYFVILPNNAAPLLQELYQHLPAFEHAEFSSATKLMTLHEIKDMLTHGGFL